MTSSSGTAARSSRTAVHERGRQHGPLHCRLSGKRLDNPKCLLDERPEYFGSVVGSVIRMRTAWTSLFS